MVECTVLCLALIPLFMVIPTIGNLIDLKQTVIQASRYSAWEHTTMSGDQPPSDVHARFLENPEALLQTGQSSTGQVNNLWNDQVTPDTDRLLPSVGDTSIGLSYQHGAGVSHESNLATGTVSTGIAQSTHRAATALTHLSSAEWNFEETGFVDAGVQLNVKKNWLFEYASPACDGRQNDSVFGCISSRTALVVDGWDSAFLDQATRRSRAFVPGAVLTGVGDVISKLGYLPVTRELKGLKGAFGYVDSTVLPLDRYAGDQP